MDVFRTTILDLHRSDNYKIRLEGSKLLKQMGFPKELALKLLQKILRKDESIVRIAAFEALNSYYGIFIPISSDDSVPLKILPKVADESSEYNRMLLYNILACKLNYNPKQLKIILETMPSESDFIRLYVMLILHYIVYNPLKGLGKLLVQFLTEASIRDPLQEAREVACQALEALQKKEKDYNKSKRQVIKKKILSLETLIRNHDSADMAFREEISSKSSEAFSSSTAPQLITPPKSSHSSLTDNQIKNVCQICKRMIQPKQKWVQCPHCHRKFHHSHFAEWVKVKGSCPVCRRRVRETPILA